MPHLPLVIVLAAYLLSSLVCLVLYGWDKRAARRGRPRISERSLLLWGLACGWPGAWLAQRCWRHKTAKASFRWRFHVTVVLNVVLVDGALWFALRWRP